MNFHKVTTGLRAGVITPAEAADQLEILLARPVPVDVNGLAWEAVQAMGDVFYDADQYANETMPCPKCGEETAVPTWDCSVCGADFDEQLSKNDWIVEGAVRCVTGAIHTALRQRDDTLCGTCGERGDCPFVGCLSSCGDWTPDGRPRLEPANAPHDFRAVAGTQTLAWVTIYPRKSHPAARRTPRNRAVGFKIYRPAGGYVYQDARLAAATTYLERLGLDSRSLLKRAREKGWEV